MNFKKGIALKKKWPAS